LPQPLNESKAVPGGVDRRAMASLSVGHLAADLAQGAPPALLVFLKPKLDLSYAASAAVILAGTVSSSLAQPLFGVWSDRRSALWLLSSGVALAGIGIAVAAVAPAYEVLLLLVFLSGLGVGAFHPEGAKVAGRASGTRRATGMSWYTIGGNIGFALGPLLGSGSILAFGLPGGLLLAVPGLLVSGLLVFERRYLTGFVPTHAGAERHGASSGQRGAFLLLLAVILLRSIVYTALFTFVPLWEVANGQSAGRGTLVLSLLLAAGAAGTVLMGPLADRFGRKPVLFWNLAASVPLVLVYVLVGGAVGVAAVSLAGACIIGTFGVTLVLSQEYLPGRVALASGLSVGLAIGLGGIMAVVLGSVADAIDLRTALLGSVAGPALAAVLTLALPPVRRRRAYEPVEPVEAPV
jgi:FSR family fosmidomycin resistance protein-like MFS transporter